MSGFSMGRNSAPPLAILIPTRNRATLAMTAIESVVRSGTSVPLLVSDNSSDPAERGLLEREIGRLNSPMVQLVSPPRSLSMSDHWEWALERLLLSYQPQAVTVLTDRMLFKHHALQDLLVLLQNPDTRVLTYRTDEIDEMSDPPRLHLASWTGDLFTLSSQRLLELAARGIVVGECFPRFMNSVVTRDVLDGVRSHFHSVFDSISPDFCFAFRCLAVEHEIKFFDRSMLVQHGRRRSNGASFGQDKASADHLDFLRWFGGTLPLATPVPDLQTVANAIFHEYVSVRQYDLGRLRLPPLDLTGYLAASAREIPHISDGRTRRHMQNVLVENEFRGLRALVAQVRYHLPNIRFLRSPRAVAARIRRTTYRDATTDRHVSPEALVAIAQVHDGPLLRQPVERWVATALKRSKAPGPTS